MYLSWLGLGLELERVEVEPSDERYQSDGEENEVEVAAQRR
jgi:hypothetical protein